MHTGAGRPTICTAERQIAEFDLTNLITFWKRLKTHTNQHLISPGKYLTNNSHYLSVLVLHPSSNNGSSHWFSSTTVAIGGDYKILDIIKKKKPRYNNNACTASITLMCSIISTHCTTSQFRNLGCIFTFTFTKRIILQTTRRGNVELEPFDQNTGFMLLNYKKVFYSLNDSCKIEFPLTPVL